MALPQQSVLVPSRDEIVVERIGRVAPLLGIVSLAFLLGLPWEAGPVVPGQHVLALIGMSVFFVGGVVASVYPFCGAAPAAARAFGVAGCGVLVLEGVCVWWLTG